MFLRLEIERCRLLTIAAAWRLIGAVRAARNTPSEWDGWQVINPDGERQRYAARGAEGVCTRCGRCPPRPGRKLCEDCAAAQRDRAAKLREKRRGAAICIQCGRLASGGHARCETCRDAIRTAAEIAARAAQS